MSCLRFADFELDEQHRELRLRGREIALQPRIFDLLVYLIQHRDRVVEKEELFDALWPGMIVTEGSLQRAISLARSALRQGGLTDAIRTYSRSGYRFVFDISSEASNVKTPAALPHQLHIARQAYEQGEWESAIEAFNTADKAHPLTGPDLERLADAFQCSGHAWDAVAPLERAVAAHTSQGDVCGAVRAMLTLSQIQFEQREYAVARAWHQRALRMLPSDEPSREHGNAMWIRSRFAAVDGELEAARDYAQQAVDIGRDLADPDIEALGLNYLGLALQAMGDVNRGAGIQDEAAAAVLAGNISPLVGGLIYCGVIWSCRNRGDWERASQWTNQFTRWCTNSALHNFPGTCRLHRAEVLSIRGELAEAENEAKAMCESLSVRAPWAEGNAYHVLGDIYLLRGELDNAESAFKRAYELGWDPQPGYSLLLLERGETEAARQTLAHSLEDHNWANRQRRGLLLANFVLISLAANDAEAAENSLAELDARPELNATDALMAMTLRARAELAAYTQNLDEAARYLRQGMRLWQNVGSPLNVALLRIRLAQILIQQNNHHTAELELQSAQNVFRSANTTALFERCQAMMQRLRDSDS